MPQEDALLQVARPCMEETFLDTAHATAAGKDLHPKTKMGKQRALRQNAVVFLQAPEPPGVGAVPSQ